MQYHNTISTKGATLNNYTANLVREVVLEVDMHLNGRVVKRQSGVWTMKTILGEAADVLWLYKGEWKTRPKGDHLMEFYFDEQHTLNNSVEIDVVEKKVIIRASGVTLEEVRHILQAPWIEK
ncbi:hypothetical protein AVT69_gp032 [Pseudomonas phage PhiPA3]|uniref:Uncharacterized protein 031 n=1 Tax=Pseudomonas phage PhiPA3 TaxID=998086 RepID=F8SJR3_BPPA3|nr:hypothetical protein AVT69_gp032 [Pseudomonas phage PhiPA3]AEH03458.1 hypothetical protein [Pseudomonas phage PhiPA3]